MATDPSTVDIHRSALWQRPRPRIFFCLLRQKDASGPSHSATNGRTTRAVRNLRLRGRSRKLPRLRRPLQTRRLTGIGSGAWRPVVAGRGWFAGVRDGAVANNWAVDGFSW